MVLADASLVSSIYETRQPINGVGSGASASAGPRAQVLGCATKFRFRDWNAQRINESLVLGTQSWLDVACRSRSAPCRS